MLPNVYQGLVSATLRSQVGNLNLKTRIKSRRKSENRASINRFRP